ncbi:hypothetical protein Fbal_2701 [Ferrimonas balearica DSM 9799]|uniref:Uncharacterized protein n=1 Tax=Ferrimonas balearica (strain DSM 9799 / CCM 4581 / KCTC 23876 / PAT) TaxID=550540 RepID=E1SQX8_FERBD|nr:hypothetical protein Fbal_2701 [Ferrimonas balearica DSM 9799]
MARKQTRRRKALSSLMERRRQCRKRTHLRVVHRIKLFSANQAESPAESSSAL